MCPSVTSLSNVSLTLDKSWAAAAALYREAHSTQDEYEKAKKVNAALECLIKLIQKTFRKDLAHNEELFSHLLLILVKRTDKLIKADNLKAYFCRCARNFLISECRRTNKLAQCEENDVPSDDYDAIQGPFKDIFTQQRKRLVESLLGQLNPQDSLILKVHFDFRLNHSELQLLSEKAGLSVEEVRQAYLNATNSYEKTQLLYADATPEAREKVLDRFLKARKRLLERLEKLATAQGLSY